MSDRPGCGPSSSDAGRARCLTGVELVRKRSTIKGPTNEGVMPLISPVRWVFAKRNINIAADLAKKDLVFSTFVSFCKILGARQYTRTRLLRDNRPRPCRTDRERQQVRLLVGQATSRFCCIENKKGPSLLAYNTMSRVRVRAAEEPRFIFSGLWAPSLAVSLPSCKSLGPRFSGCPVSLFLGFWGPLLAVSSGLWVAPWLFGFRLSESFLSSQKTLLLFLRSNEKDLAFVCFTFEMRHCN